MSKMREFGKRCSKSIDIETEYSDERGDDQTECDNDWREDECVCRRRMQR